MRASQKACSPAPGLQFRLRGGDPGCAARATGCRGDVPEALRMLDAALDYLNGPLTGDLPAGAHGEALAALGRVSGKLAAARAQVLSRFDATRGHDADGYGSSRSLLAAHTRGPHKAAGTERP